VVDHGYDEKDADVVVSTAHKAKGREWDVVRLGSDFSSPKDGAMLGDSELRLLYVAATRASRHLDYETCPAMRYLFGLDREAENVDTALILSDLAIPPTLESSVEAFGHCSHCGHVYRSFSEQCCEFPGVARINA
jgi:hypothetical protein